MLVASFAFEAHIEARLTSYYRNRTKADYLARSGLAIAELLMSKTEGLAGTEEDSEKAATDPWYRYAKQLADGVPVTVEHDMAEQDLGEGCIVVKITPEPALLNINALSRESNLIKNVRIKDEIWERILEVAGVPEEMWAELIESFYDWTDANDEPEPYGAESDYYDSLDDPYTARNGPLDTVGELLLIQGFTREILDGGVLMEGFFDDETVRCSGIRDMLTTYGNGKLNVNAASEQVLMTLPGVDQNIAQLIVEERSGWTDELGVTHDESFEGPADFLARIPEVPVEIRDIISTQSAIYRITSTGKIHGVTRGVWCIVEFTGERMKIMRWREDD